MVLSNSSADCWESKVFGCNLIRGNEAVVLFIDDADVAVRFGQLEHDDRISRFVANELHRDRSRN